jgi:hypothetical protein
MAADQSTMARWRVSDPRLRPIGLDSKGGGAKQSRPSMADRIVSYASRRRGERVGDGECFTLVDRALRAADAKSAADYGTYHPMRPERPRAAHAPRRSPSLGRSGSIVRKHAEMNWYEVLVPIPHALESVCVPPLRTITTTARPPSCL